MNSVSGMRDGRPPDVLPGVRQAATSTAIGAALMLFFGYAHLARPDGTDLFGYASFVLYHALRIGGLISAGIAIWLWFGHRPALIVDAVVAVVLGAILVLSGIAMVIDGGYPLQPAIITICGASFVSSGIRSGRTYRRLTGVTRGSPLRTKGKETAEVMPPVRHRAPEPSSRVESSTRRTTSRLSSNQITGPRNGGDSVAVSEESHGAEKEESASAGDSVVEPPPEGFLASFARKNPPS